jgi:hypothetical protein
MVAVLALRTSERLDEGARDEMPARLATLPDAHRRLSTLPDAHRHRVVGHVARPDDVRYESATEI